MLDIIFLVAGFICLGISFGIPAIGSLSMQTKHPIRPTVKWGILSFGLWLAAIVLFTLTLMRSAT